ncbi:MAG: patatin-like phospholipase family protein [Gammaproteobacteria bacterium]|nr:patatin-like phospholipase family protein [Gammaproteobacteria bacterium]
MLSGAGALGPFHVGVIKALFEQGLLPNVISGASAGSVVAAILGTRPNEELEDIFDPKTMVSVFDEATEVEAEVLRGDTQMSVHDLKHFVETNIPDLTFQEAFELTGRRIDISVSPREVHQQSRAAERGDVTRACVFVRR